MGSRTVPAHRSTIVVRAVSSPLWGRTREFHSRIRTGGFRLGEAAPYRSIQMAGCSRREVGANLDRVGIWASSSFTNARAANDLWCAPFALILFFIGHAVQTHFLSLLASKTKNLCSTQLIQLGRVRIAKAPSDQTYSTDLDRLHRLQAISTRVFCSATVFAAAQRSNCLSLESNAHCLRPRIRMALDWRLKRHLNDHIYQPWRNMRQTM